MSTRTRPKGRSRSEARAARDAARPGDDLLNQRVADALREAADARNARNRATAVADARANDEVRDTIQVLIDGHMP